MGKVPIGRESVFGLRFSYKITATILVLVIFASAVVAVLAYHKYKSILDALILSRLEVTAGDLHNGIQAPLRLGLSLSDVQTMQALIDRTLGQDRLITAIYVFEAQPEPRLVYQAVKPGIPVDTLRQDWIDAVARQSGGRFWRGRSEGGHVVGTTLVDRLEQPVGGVAMVYSPAYAAQRVDAITQELFDYVIIVSGAVAAIGFLLVQVLFRPVSRRLKTLAAQAVDPGDAQAAAAAAAADDALGAAIGREYARFDAAARAAEVALTDAELALDTTAGRKQAS